MNMKRYIIALLIMLAVIFGPLKPAGSNGIGVNNHQADVAGPLPSSVVAVASTISGIGVAGGYILSRRQR
jgi:hypothetical protein